MTDPLVEGGGHASGRGIIAKTLLLVAFAVATFLAGRLWSLRGVREAQQAAGLAEKERLALQAELIECRNALLLQRQRGEVSAGDKPDENATNASRAHTAGHHSTQRPPAVGP